MINWSQHLHLFGTVPDTEIAKTLGVHPDTVLRQRRKAGIPSVHAIDWGTWDRALGSKTDRALAQDIGCATVTVTKRRRALGVPPASGPGRGNRKAIDWAQWDDLLGTVSDQALANRIGCSWLSVRNRRVKVGVEAWSKSQKKIG